MISKEDLLELRRTAYIECTQHFLENNNVVGVFGCNIPLNLIYGYNLIPVPMEGVDSHIFQYGEESNVCDVIKSTIIYLKTQKCPILYSCKIFIVSNDCPVFVEKLKEATDKPVYTYKDENMLSKILEKEYNQTFNKKLYKISVDSLDYIENMLERIELYTDLDSEILFFLRYYTPYITDLTERKKLFQSIESELKFFTIPVKKQIYTATCPRGVYKSIPLQNKVLIRQSWEDSDYGYKYCPKSHLYNLKYM